MVLKVPEEKEQEENLIKEIVLTNRIPEEKEESAAKAKPLNKYILSI